MGIPHKAVNCKRIIFLFFVFVSIMTGTQGAQAYDSLFVVENVDVDVTAESSVVAQEQAFEEAQKKAFEILSSRMVEDAQVAQMSTPDMATISSFVKDYEITKESLTNVRYVGTYTFRFDEDAVGKYFSVSGVRYTDTSSKPLLVLPIFQLSGKNSIWSENNIWMKSWAKTNLPKGIVPVEVPIGDLMDIADINDNDALRYDRRQLDRMLGRYNAKEAAIMIAVPDQNLVAVATDEERAIGSLRISIYRTDRAAAEHVQDLLLDAKPEETRAQIYTRAVRNAHSALQKDWKNKTVTSSADQRSFNVRAVFNSLKQWTKLKQALSGTLGVRNISVQSLKRSEALVSFSFRGDEAKLRETLRYNALTLGEKMTYSYGGQNKTYYDLSVGHKRTNTSGGYSGVEPSSGSAPNSSGSMVHTF